MSSSRILVLGSGMVARPCVDYLARNPVNRIIVACRTLASSESLVAGLPRARAISLDVSLEEELEPEIRSHDVVISLVPYVFHPKVAELAIKNGKHLVTTSYNNPSIQALEQAAKEAGVTILNEVGFDPGVDHLYAIKKIDEVHSKGGKILEFHSYGGGLPAPEQANNPLRYKFSWSPRGAFLASYNPAVFLKDGKVVQIPGRDLMRNAYPYHVIDGYDLVAYPNRDSLSFRDYYKIPEARTIIRGTLRYAGNPLFLKTLLELGWLDTEPKPWLKQGISWAQIWQHLIKSENTSEVAILSRVQEICDFLTELEANQIIDGLRWMGILSSDEATVVAGTLIDTLCARVYKLMAYQPGERDLILLQHKFLVEWADGKQETHTSTLELFGNPKGYSGMAFSVGLTCGIATQLLLNEHPAVKISGVLCPYQKDMCDTIREIVEQEGIKLIERKL